LTGDASVSAGEERPVGGGASTTTATITAVFDAKSCRRSRPANGIWDAAAADTGRAHVSMREPRRLAGDRRAPTACR
jgi:hypothetical protein